MPIPLINLDPKNIPANPWIRLHPADNVVVARVHIPAGATLDFQGTTLKTVQAIAPGHKIAVQTIAEGATVAPGDPVRYYAFGDLLG